jgi:acyl-coenzyme A synthetase/AMP-(fatty) acid ligase
VDHCPGAADGPHHPLPLAFAAWAAEAPASECIANSDRWVTVGEIAARAGGLLEELRSLEPGPVLIAPRDAVELAVSLLGATGSGRLVVLADPRRSSDALARLAEGAGAGVAVTQHGRIGGLTCLAPEGHLADGYHPVEVVPDDAFALLSTSGSTGEPKFVRATHRALMLRRSDASVDPGRSLDDRAMLPFNYSAAVMKSVGEFLVGRVPILAIDPLVVPMSAFLRRAVDSEVTYARITPSLLRRAVQAAPDGLFLPKMRAIGGAGEPMFWSDVAALRQLVPRDCLIYHGYSSTETSGITRRLISSDEPIGEGTVPVGEPVLGRRVWIDAGGGVPAVPEAVGEIVVEGVFGTHSPRFVDLGDGRVQYRTGDLGSIDHRGELRHHGRADRMVKIGGVRIEPTAVEAVLRSVQGVRDVAVVSVDLGPTHGVRLAAHVVVDVDQVRDVEPLRRAAVEQLASAAVPARFFLRNEPLPLLPSGKTDLRALTGLVG